MPTETVAAHAPLHRLVGLRPYYDEAGITIYHGDCAQVLPFLDPVDLLLTDPPHGDTSLDWDSEPATEWIGAAKGLAASIWCYGSMRFHMASDEVFSQNGYSLAQDVIWEKHNGSGFASDRFRRVHEIAVHWYRGKYSEIYFRAPKSGEMTARPRRRGATPHLGSIGAESDGRPAEGIMRSVIYCESCHGHAEHPTQKPIGAIAPIMESSCPPGGVVLDPFMGSGTTLVVAKNQGKRAIGIERELKYCEIAVRRLAQQTLFQVEQSNSPIRQPAS